MTHLAFDTAALYLAATLVRTEPLGSGELLPGLALQSRGLLKFVRVLPSRVWNGEARWLLWALAGLAYDATVSGYVLTLLHGRSTSAVGVANERFVRERAASLLHSLTAVDADGLPATTLAHSYLHFTDRDQLAGIRAEQTTAVIDAISALVKDTFASVVYGGDGRRELGYWSVPRGLSAAFYGTAPGSVVSAVDDGRVWLSDALGLEVDMSTVAFALLPLLFLWSRRLRGVVPVGYISRLLSLAFVFLVNSCGRNPFLAPGLPLNHFHSPEAVSPERRLMKISAAEEDEAQ